MGPDSLLVSIIIPVFKVETYLEECLESICSQTYKSLEIIIIDDGSPDTSGKIADAYALKDARITVFHIDNIGAAGARNVGLKHCHGDYIAFVDSDDWLESSFIETMVQTILKKDVDLVQCQFYDEYKNISCAHTITDSELLFSNQSFIRHLLYHWEDALLWNKIYRKELLENLLFTEGHCIDDEFFTYQALMKAGKTYLLTDLLYHYRQRKNSLMRSEEKKTQRLKDRIEFVTERYDRLYRQYPELRRELLENIINVFMEVMRGCSGNKPIYRAVKKKLIQYGMKAVFDREINLNLKKSIVLYALSSEGRIIRQTEGAEFKLEYYE